MADLSVTERRIRPIQDAASAGNWKQALQLCDKWQKKGEKSDRFLALKASVLVNQPDDANRKKGKNETLGLCHRPSAITDIEAIYLLQASLKRLDLDKEEGSKLWEKATAALPDDKDFLTTWLHDSLSQENWLAAQKAATALRKGFPKERQYDFLNILLCYLIHQDDRISDKERFLFGTLAYRLISKAAEAVPSNEDQLLASGKAIATLEELALLVKIYLSTGRAAEARSLLEDPRFALESRIAKQDPQMVFSLLIDVLDASDDSKTVMNVCTRLLTGNDAEAADISDDDRLWRTLVRRTGSDETYAEDCLELVKTTLQTHPKCRAALTARLSLLQRASETKVTGQDDLLTACKEYINLFGNKPFCFGDIVDTLGALDQDQLSILKSQSLSGTQTDLRRNLHRKLDYNAIAREADPSALLSFASGALELHKSLPERSNERSESALLAALALIRAGLQISEMSLLVQASYILEHGCTDFRDYYPLAVRLLQLQRSLGLLSLCMNRFGSLSVKNLQWETVGHLLLTRISSLHPLQCEDEDGTLDPLRALDAGSYMSRSAEKSLDDQIRKGLNFGSYTNVLDSVSLKQNVRNSLNRYLFKLEERRIKALTSSSTTGVLEVPSTPLKDQRDFSFLDTYGVKDRTLEDFLQGGPQPKQQWLDTVLMWDHIRTAIDCDLSDHTNHAKEALAAYTTLHARTAQANASSDTQTTDAEKSRDELQQSIATIALAISGTANTASEVVDKAVTNLLSWLNNLKSSNPVSINKIQIPLWDYIHLRFTQLEALQTISSLITLLLKKLKSKSATKNSTLYTIKKDDVTKIQAAAWNAKKTIHEQIWALKEGLNAPGVLGKLVDVVGGRLQNENGDDNNGIAASKEYQELADVLGGMYDEVALEGYCGKMRDSWEDALDGILAVKVNLLDVK